MIEKDIIVEPPDIKTRICFTKNTIVKRIPGLDIIKPCNINQSPYSSYVLKMINITSPTKRFFEIRKFCDDRGNPNWGTYTLARADVFCKSKSSNSKETIFISNSHFRNGKEDMDEFVDVIKYALEILNAISRNE
jgi:hypothetical protein